MIINEHSFALELANHQIIFSGSGSNKLKDLISHQNVIFSNALHRVSHLATLSADAFNQRKFNDLAYSEPFYLKEFFNPTKK
jgi:tRNA threonylcarbamoyladenosine biosynthesis protein TsaB